MPTEYDKLVRDRIPTIIEADGKRPVIHTATDEEYEHRLAAKLQEETAEFAETGAFEELADVLEVIYAIVDHRDRTMEDVERRRREKRGEHGGFEERLVLERVKTEE